MTEEQKEVFKTDTPGLWERTGQENRFEYQVAGFWMRFWAYSIDLILVASLSGMVLTPLIRFTSIIELSLGIYSLGGFIGAVISFGYFVLQTKVWGQTLGKRILGLRVLPVGEQSLSWKDVMMRELVGRYIHQSFAITNLLYLVIPFHPHKKGLHDMIADTIVVLEPRR